MVRDSCKDEFIEIFVDTPLAECIARDPKGLTKRPWPERSKFHRYHSELRAAGGARDHRRPRLSDREQAAAQIVALLTARGLIDRIDGLADDWSI